MQLKTIVNILMPVAYGVMIFLLVHGILTGQAPWLTAAQSGWLAFMAAQSFAPKADE